MLLGMLQWRMATKGEQIRVRGRVQGVGFRPTVWRLARDCGLAGEVLNDAEGVLIRAWGEKAALDRFVERLRRETPPLARIDAVERQALTGRPESEWFHIGASEAGTVSTQVAPDAATCPACLGEALDPDDRRFRYPFTNCTHCGPRLSIVYAIPYDRGNTSMAAFPMCDDCQAEYDDPNNRRFHAQPNACPVCGPQTWLVDRAGSRVRFEDDVDCIGAAARLIRGGSIIAIKGLGGFHLACDAGNDAAVSRLRQSKRRFGKPFALMARDVDEVRSYCGVNTQEEALLASSNAPIVVLAADGSQHLAAQVAPSQRTLGFMLPYTPLHHLLMQDLERPIVLTSGNVSDEAQCTDNDEARQRLRDIADYWLLHNRDIVNRLDDSVLRVMDGNPRMLRRARGYAPEPILLPAGFDTAPSVCALGGELKNTFCMLRKGEAIVSQHVGDLEDASCHRDFRYNLDLYRQLFQFEPSLLAIDMHPDYFSSQWGRQWAAGTGLGLEEVQHHHAHIASCMAENGLPLDTAPVLGLALDGLGYGDDGRLWGGELMQVDYTGCKRLASFQPIALIGGAQAMREPWRNTFAHLVQAFGWPDVEQHWGHVECVRHLVCKPVEALLSMVERHLNCPPAASAGRLFDAVAAAAGVCRDSVDYEGQAAVEFEALVDNAVLAEAGSGYAFGIRRQQGIVLLSFRALWQAVLEDLADGVPAALIAARFHLGLARALTGLLLLAHKQTGIRRVALGGGVFQNMVLLEQLCAMLRRQHFEVLVPQKLPVNDGGLSLGQAAVAAARILSR